MKSCPVCGRNYADVAEVCLIDGGILTDAKGPQDTLLGQIIKGRYRVLKKLGAGGMGTVYLAEQLSIGRNVALKVLHGEIARDEGFIKRFRQEARLAATLSHRNVITVHDFDQADDGSLFIAMEHVDGKNLKEVLQQGPLEVSRALHLGIQIAEGLAAAHRVGVIHRDIKPENIMLVSGTDEIKLMDFGIARLRETGTTARLTRSGMIMGTPAYMAPEQIEGREVSERTDIYAFGIVLYEMLSGAAPFHAPTPSAVLLKHLSEQPVPLRRLRKNIPSSVERVVMQALEKKPDRRQDSFTEVAEKLHEAAGRPQSRTPVLQALGAALGRRKEPQSVLREPDEKAAGFARTLTETETQTAAETLPEIQRITSSGRPRKWKYVGIGGLVLLLSSVVALGVYSWLNWYDTSPIVSLKIDADRSQLELSERTWLKLRARHSDGAEKEVVEGIQWQSSDSSVATVNSSGEVVAIKPGQTEITASYEGKTSNPLSLAINSREPPVRIPEPPIREITNLVVAARKNAIIVGERTELTAIAKYSDGSEEKNLAEVRWESSDPAVARVDDSGKLEGLRQGQVRVTARYGDRVSRSMTFTVGPAVQLDSLAIHVEKTELKINERIAASVKGTYSDGKVASLSKGVKWKSGDATIAEVDPEGQVTAYRSGRVDITASYGTMQSQPLGLSVIPDAPKLVALRLHADRRELKVGGAEPLRAVGKYSDGKEQEVASGITWRSSDNNIAEVRSQGDGRALVIGRSTGKAIISATHEGAIGSRLSFVVTDAVAGKKKEAGEAVLLGRYRVIRSTTVLAEARKDSRVVANLSPGITVNVVGGTEEYLRIESKTGKPPGYVIRSDVEPAEEKGSTSGQEAGKSRVAHPIVAARWANSKSEAGRLALADCGQGGEGCRIIRSVCTTKTGSPQYGAIAYSLSRRAHGYSFDYANPESARARAVSECGADCIVAVQFRDACAALAVGQTR